MKPVIPILAIGLFLLPPLRSAELEIQNSLELRGIVHGPDGNQFVIYDSASKESSTWLKLDSTWKFWTLQAYNEKTKQLTIVKGGRSELLSMRTSVIQTSKFQPRDSKQPLLLAGSFSLTEGAKVYSDDAKISLGTDLVMTSPAGVMVSDLEARTFKGDLEFETKNGKFFAPNGTVRQKEGGGTVVEAKTFYFPPVTRSGSTAVPK